MQRENSEIAENRVFEKTAFGEKSPVRGIYEECRFLYCCFSNADLSGVTFRKCMFEGCDFTLAKMKNTSLQDVHFIECKLLGVQFGDCRPFLLELWFERCMMRFSTFLKLNLRNTGFRNCDMQEADFSEADLSSAVFEESDLLQAIFFHTNLEKADFRSAFNYSINPETNRIRKARFSIPAVIGLLDVWDIEIE
ncbi:pentapeptide repeat-containing protein [Chlorobium phaeobacteroides]|jgi:uncharacterized protein YjbI with pentapeptide repeats|uniref:Pentapeptide repeat protein n=1 Tax=Chlorobium phaeobacteroides (strain DSM 266 / SMG 266 / 2430) TaxID=290317 RepID=A1BHX0_CHLPD|nr:pentapeptide repeat-containing protein [Chlorobium phaeobacteroides]ABL65997.1 pentapeptide repeat protein [Chlorobium phaeobacteroides DSM 266]MBV5328564.1 pentapeptide repeat-containing protein [Chlorobium sp.]